MRRRVVLVGSVLFAVAVIGQGCASRSTTRTEKVRHVDEPSTAQQTPTQPQRSQKQPPSFATASNPAQSASSKPVRILLARADSEFDAGNLEQSAANLERAIRIAPRDAVIWHKLATVYLHQGEAEQAETMARKSNSLTTTNDSLWVRNWRVIAEARRLRGDTAGAKQAERRAQAREQDR